MYISPSITRAVSESLVKWSAPAYCHRIIHTYFGWWFCGVVFQYDPVHDDCYSDSRVNRVSCLTKVCILWTLLDFAWMLICFQKKTLLWRLRRSGFCWSQKSTAHLNWPSFTILRTMFIYRSSGYQWCKKICGFTEFCILGGKNTLILSVAPLTTDAELSNIFSITKKDEAV